MNSIILQLITLHDYNNLKLVVLTHEGSTLNSIRNLNHVWNNERSFRYFATNLHEAENISTELVRIWNSFNNDQVDLKNKAMVETYYVIISDLYENFKTVQMESSILVGESVDLAEKIDKTFISNPNITFIIGGSNGIREDILNKRLDNLSNGERRMVGIASILIYNPSIIEKYC